MKSLPWKRPFDLVLGSLACLALFPLMGVVALLVRWDSPGPVLYRQERVGRHGSRFMMLKFRSMHPGSDDRYHREAAAAWYAGTPSPEGYKSERDPRITPVGRFLRRTTLDELPQIFNVLRGDMSLVGPRPSIPYELEYYEPWYLERLLVKPGMTGLWQVSGRDRLSASEMMALDRRYLQACSLGLDARILAATLPAVVANFTKRSRRE